MKAHIQNLIAAQCRLDGRAPEEFRDVKVEYDVAELAEGSARVTIGDTVVIAGIKLSLQAPYPDTPEEGTIMVGAEQLPLSNPSFEMGPPNESAIEWARVIDRGIREGHAMDLKKLCIEPGKLAWSVSIDIYPINDAGNLLDAGSLAAMAALKNTVFPEIENDKINYKKKSDKKLELEELPVACTVLKIGPHIIVDPLTEEEKVSDARLTVATRSDGTLCALQKGGCSPLSSEDIKSMIEIAAKHSAKLREKL